MPTYGSNSAGKRSLPQLVPSGEYAGRPPILLNRPVYQIGAARESCRIRLTSSTVSQVHAIIVQTRHLTYIRDLNSRTHVYVNDQQVRESPLHDGDVIRIGRFEFVYRGPRRDYGSEPPAPPATLEVTGSPIPLPIEERVVLIGRRPNCDIPLVEDSVSNAHAVIFQWETKRFVRDLGSRTGTYLNGERIHEKELSPGDVIRVGETEIRYLPSTESASVDVVESASDSMIAAAPSAQEISIPVAPVVESSIGLSPSESAIPVTPSLHSLADTIGEIDTIATGHHDTAMLPIPLDDHAAANLSGLDLLPPEKTEEPPMARTWRGSSSVSLPILNVDEPALAPLVEPPAPVEVPLVDPAAETLAGTPADDLPTPRNLELSAPAVPVHPEPILPEDDLSDLGLTSDLADTPTSVEADAAIEVNDLGLSADLRDLPDASAAAPALGTIDLSSPAVESLPVAEASVEPLEMGAKPLIASDALDHAAEPQPLKLPEISDLPEPPPMPDHREPEVTLASILDDALGETPSPIPDESLLEAAANTAALNLVPHEVEVIDSTQPTPESALESPPPDDTLVEAGGDALSDTTFGRQVSEFTATTTGEIIEPAAESHELAVDAAGDVDTGAQPQLLVTEDAAPLPDEATSTIENSSSGPRPGAMPENLVPVDVGLAMLSNINPSLAGMPAKVNAVLDTAMLMPAVRQAVPATQEASPAEPTTVTAPAAEEPAPIAADDLAMRALSDESSASQPPVSLDASGDVNLNLVEAEPEPPALELAAEPEAAVETAGEGVEPLFAPSTPPVVDTPALNLTEPDIPPVDSTTTSGPVSLSGLPQSKADPFDLPAQGTAIPPRPLKRRRDRKQAVIRNFGQDAGSPDAPFAGAKGEASPIDDFGVPSPSMDVFGHASPAATDPFAIPPADAQALSAGRGRREGLAPRPVESPGGTEPPRRPIPAVTYGEAAPNEAMLRRRTLLRRVPVVAVVGALLAIAISVGAFFFVPVLNDIQVSMKFENVDAGNQARQLAFQERQIKTLQLDKIRGEAVRRLRDRYPTVVPGFLEDQTEFFKVVGKARWSDQQKGTLLLKYSGDDARDDGRRLLMIAAALWANNADYIREYDDAARGLRDAREQVERGDRRLTELAEEIEKNGLIAERYLPEKLTAANIQVQQLEKGYNDAIAALKGAQAELERLKKAQPTRIEKPEGGEIDPAADEELAKLTKSAKELSAKLEAARAERAGFARQARESLDKAYDEFQKQIASAQGAMQQSPELARFVETAQSQLRAIRELTDQFIASQQTEYQQLAKVKSQLDEKIQARRSDLWAKDEQLQQLAEQKEITVRKINAARSDGLDKEAGELENDLQLIENSIRARQDVLSGDPLYADVINVLQQLIEQKQRQMAEDRKKTDEKLANLQRQFTANLPAVEKLPQEQQALAEQLKARLSEVDAARRQYASAADVTSLENDVVIKNLSEELSRLQGDIDVRKQQLTAAQTGAASRLLAEEIARKQAEVEALAANKDQAEKAFFAAQATLREIQQLRAEAQTAEQRRNKAIEERSTLEKTLVDSRAFLNSAQKKLAEAIRPIEPTEADIAILRERDYRTDAAMGGGGGMLAITALVVVWLLYAAAKANPYHYGVVEELETPAAEPGKSDRDNSEEENQPAVV